MSKNFSAPKSAPNPASVTVYSPNFSASFVATILLHPCAMFANGPPCTNAGVCSRVCTKLGFIASFNSAAIAPCAFKSLAYTGSSLSLYPIIIFPKFSFNSFILFDKHKIAIISDATVISNPSFLGSIFFSPDIPVSTNLNCLSFKSRHLFHVTFFIFSSFPKYI